MIQTSLREFNSGIPTNSCKLHLRAVKYKADVVVPIPNIRTGKWREHQLRCERQRNIIRRLTKWLYVWTVFQTTITLTDFRKPVSDLSLKLAQRSLFGVIHAAQVCERPFGYNNLLLDGGLAVYQNVYNWNLKMRFKTVCAFCLLFCLSNLFIFLNRRK